MRWEDGEYITKTIASTNGNVATTLSPGTYRKWKVLYGRIKLICDATVANRQIVVAITDSGGNYLTGYIRTGNITASATDYETLYPDYENVATGAVDDAGHKIRSDNWVICGTDRLRITITAGVAGDQYSGYIKIVELPA